MIVALRQVSRELVLFAQDWTRGELIAGLWQHVQSQPELRFVAAEVEGRVRFFDRYGRRVRASSAHGTEITLAEAREVAA